MQPEITVVRRLNTPHQNQNCEALISGLESLGIPYAYHKSQHTPITTKKAAMWGWRMPHLRQQGIDVLCMEHGYIGDRSKYSSLGWNGLNNYASFPSYPDDRGARFKEHGGVIKPWNLTGDYILILGQVKGDSSLKGKDIEQWYSKLAKEVRRYYGLPVYFRPHPVSRRRGGYLAIKGIPKLEGSLEEAINGAFFTIAYNSNACLDSILSGVPCFAGDMGTVAWDLCMKDLHQIIRPERESTVHRIAWTQWTLEEIASGFALRALFA